MRWRRMVLTLPELDGKSWRETLAERRQRALGERRALASPSALEQHPFALLLWLGACEWQDRRIRFVGGLLLTSTFLIHLLWSMVTRWL